ncbi:hypothetical protein L1987_81749 [Smallanthus sonchifolius]|uniref:Uncharacterized protein n=1 Tax=Smallanthus sonchifolius TaxID=185202 RepID=A0ACB8YRY4_9ASTR|nr:hypothetical protein L1987_81749 [Smallanthus sonchifolius]
MSPILRASRINEKGGRSEEALEASKPHIPTAFFLFIITHTHAYILITSFFFNKFQSFFNSSHRFQTPNSFLQNPINNPTSFFNFTKATLQ